MNTFIIIFLCAGAFLNTVRCLEYDVDEDYSDIDAKDYERRVKSARAEGIEDTEEKGPQYDISDAKNLFDRFILDNKKTYADRKEYDQRYINFVNNLEDIIRINKEGGNADINLFADLSESELSSLNGGVPFGSILD